MTTPLSATPDGRVHIDPWPSEVPLFVLCLLASLGIWALAFISIIGIVYGVMLGLFFFVMHLALVAHVRGNGVRLGPEQLPEIHDAVLRLSQRIGLAKPPEAYVIQGGGVLNAFATRFIGSDILILYAELIEACGDDTAARDMIIAHELGHVHRGHVRWMLAIVPAMLIPFLGTAYSRAREYTCDRYGVAGAGSREGALHGMTILAAGGRLSRRVNQQQLVAQRADLNTGWMTIGEWLSTHPPLAKRMAQIEPALAVIPVNPARGVVRAFAIIGACAVPFAIAGVIGLFLLPAFFTRLAEQQKRIIEQQQQQLSRSTRPADADDEPEYTPPPPDVAVPRAKRDVAELAAFVEAEVKAGRDIPWDTSDLYERLSAAHASREELLDPYDGHRYGYRQRGNQFIVYSVGPDGEYRIKDDVVYESTRLVIPVVRP